MDMMISGNSLTFFNVYKTISDLKFGFRYLNIEKCLAHLAPTFPEGIEMPGPGP
jgi:hypothetical protein